MRASQIKIFLRQLMCRGIAALRRLEAQSMRRTGRCAARPRLNCIGQVFLPLLIWLPSVVTAATALPDTSARAEGLCTRAARHAAAQTGVPLNVLLAIALNESARQTANGPQPWPWTVNMSGRGLYFPTRAAATAYAATHLNQGAELFDIGCFQINYRWHGKAFRSLDSMFDPEENALYAARFLQDLHAEFGDWQRAAGAYHSRNPAHAGPYSARFRRQLARLSNQPSKTETLVAARDAPKDPAISEPPLSRTRLVAADYPLLRGETSAGLGSLVPLAEDGHRPFLTAAAPQG